MKTLTLIAALSLGLSAAAGAQTAPTAAPAATSPAAALADGEVRKVDRDAGKLTLRHGEIKNLDMPPMTMVFRVANPKLIEGLKEGDQVRFSADRVNGALTVTAIKRPT